MVRRVAAIEYVEKQVLDEIEIHYISINIKMKNFLKNEQPSEESANSIACCHAGYWNADMSKVKSTEFDTN